MDLSPSAVITGRMAHTYVRSRHHVVFSTHHRRPLIDAQWRGRLHMVMGGIAQRRGFPPLAAGGVSDHVHLLIASPATLPLSTCMRLVEGISSTWINDAFSPRREFAWQEGYGAFSIAQSLVAPTVASLRAQEAHHRQWTFQEFLKRQGLEWDERYAWG